MAASLPKNERPTRLSAEDWALAALDVIAEQGLAAVAVEPLARRLGVTKGSFTGISPRVKPCWWRRWSAGK